MRLFLVALPPTLLLAAAAAAEPADAPPPDAPPPLIQEIAPDADPGQRLSAGADYLLWWLREGRIPATLTTSSQASQGILGEPDTRLLYGDDRLRTRHGDEFNGVRFNLAYWLDDAHSVAVEGNAFFLERDSTYFKAVSDGSTLLARPYVNADGDPAGDVIAGDAPAGPRTGGFVGYSRVELYGEEVNLAAPLYTADAFRLEALAGARFLQMRDRTDLTATGWSLPIMSTLYGLEDHYRAADAYYGGQVGLRGERTWGRWSVQACGEVGLGGNAEQVRAFGQSIYQTPAERIVTPTGLTVQASNTGTFDRGAVNFVSEAGVNVGCQLTRRVRLSGGYTFLLWDGVLRSGDQIDPVVNTNAGAAPARPSIPFKDDVFWAQGLNVGLTLSW